MVVPWFPGWEEPDNSSRAPFEGWPYKNNNNKNSCTRVYKHVQYLIRPGSSLLSNHLCSAHFLLQLTALLCSARVHPDWRIGNGKAILENSAIITTTLYSATSLVHILQYDYKHQMSIYLELFSKTKISIEVSKFVFAAFLPVDAAVLLTTPRHAHNTTEREAVSLHLGEEQIQSLNISIKNDRRMEEDSKMVS